MQQHSPLAFSSLVLTLAASCGGSSHGLEWGIDFEEPSLRARTTLVEAQVRSGGCDGATVFSTRISGANAGKQPADFPSGRYGFYARARDSSCIWFAMGCVERELPTDSKLTVVLHAVATSERDLACVPGDENQGAAMASEGGTQSLRDANAEAPDASSEGGMTASGPEPDAGLSLVDAGADAGPSEPSTDCAGITPDVVACYDFDGHLTDASRQHNDAQGSAAKFERLGADRALRVQGSVVSVADHESLDLETMTLEFWLRADSIKNLAREDGEMSILLDKDQQYLAGFTDTGSPTFSVYDFRGRQSTITAETVSLKAGELVYLAFTYDGTTAILYVDGVHVQDKVINGGVSRGTSTMYIGTGSPDATHPFDGLIDALRISDRAHTDAEICARAGKELSDGQCK
jgi:hypothetical protein